MLAATAPALAQSDGFLLFTDPGGYYSIEFPRDWRWTIVAGSREPMAMFVQQRSEAAIIVERSRMRQRLAPADITEVFANIEVDSLKETQPRISGVTARIETWGSSRVIVIDYTRPGGAENERIRRYLLPRGAGALPCDMYGPHQSLHALRALVCDGGEVAQGIRPSRLFVDRSLNRLLTPPGHGDTEARSKMGPCASRASVAAVEAKGAQAPVEFFRGG